MGFIEETGAAQYYRDAKILTIYEGTTAIQANDLVGRKTARDGGQTAQAIAAQIEATEGELAKRDSAARTRDAQAPARGAPGVSSTWSTSSSSSSKTDAQRGVRRQRALPDAGRQPDGRLADGARAAGGRRPPGRRASDADFMHAKIATARFYADHILSQVPGHARQHRRRRRRASPRMALEAF